MALKYVALIALCMQAASGVRTRSLRAPDDDHLGHELIDNAKHKDGEKPKGTDEKDFAWLDRNKDGSLDAKELTYKQFASGCEPSVAHARGLDYLQCGDKNKDGKISEEEFKESTKPAWAACVKDLKDRRLHGFVRFFEADEDWDNKLSLNELNVGIQKMWGPAGHHLAKPLLDCVDKNKDNYMQQDEFHDSIAGYNPATRSWQMWEGTSDPTILACLQPAFKKFDAALAFEIMDTNQNQKVSKQECFDTMDSQEGSGVMDHDTANKIFAAADLDKSNDLSLDEFIKAGESYKGKGESFALQGFSVEASKIAKTGMASKCHDQNGEEWNAYVNIGATPQNVTAPHFLLSNITKK